MAKVVITRIIPGSAINLLQQSGYSLILGKKEAPMSRGELLNSIVGAEAVLTQMQDKVDEEFLTVAGPQLKIVANYAVGFDNFDIKAIESHGIVATNTPDVLTEAVAEHTIALIFAVARRIVEADMVALRQTSEFGPEVLLGMELKGKVLGILGTGRIGSRVAEVGKAIGMQVVYYDLKPNPDLETKLGARFIQTSEELLKTADVISIHVPLLDSTFHLLNEARLAMMKPTAILVNTSRGAVIDEEALAKCLANHQIRGAGLDVLEHEPRITPGLDSLMNVIITPHIASATEEARTAMGELAAKNIVAVLSGQPAFTPIKS